MSSAAFEPGAPVTLPAVAAAQMAEVDRIMVEDLGIALVQMMENAGRSLAELTIACWQPARVVVLAGPGGNGGGGMVAARHLANRGSDVEVVLSDPARLTDVPAHQRTILDAMGVPVHDAAQLSDRRSVHHCGCDPDPRATEDRDGRGGGAGRRAVRG